jgi:hypothetical protein
VSSHPADTSLPRSVRWSVRCWFPAVAAGVVETAIWALTSQDYHAAAQLPVRAAVYVVATALIIQLGRGRNWARIALTVLLGGVGLLSLLAEPVSWLAAGGSTTDFLTAADGATLTVVAVRIAHVAAVLTALVLMYRPTANMFFGRVAEEEQVA